MIVVSWGRNRYSVPGVNHMISRHYSDVIMGAMVSQIISLTIVFFTVYSGVDQGKHQSSASLALVGEIHRSPANSPPQWPVMRKIFPFDDIVMETTHFRSKFILSKQPYTFASSTHGGEVTSYLIFVRYSTFLLYHNRCVNETMNEWHIIEDPHTKW